MGRCVAFELLQLRLQDAGALVAVRGEFQSRIDALRWQFGDTQVLVEKIKLGDDQ